MFKEAIKNSTETENGAFAYSSTLNANLDLFYNIGASRGSDIIPLFIKAFEENADQSIRIALWARDIRGGSGERQLFRDILKYLSLHNVPILKRVLERTPDIGRWDDIFEIIGISDTVDHMVFEVWNSGIISKNGLCAKWTPRKGKIAGFLRKKSGLSPKVFRKTLVNLTNVVEQQMCSREWDNIEYSKVPSKAHTIYKKAFQRHSTNYDEYLSKLEKGETKVNAGAVYPYEVIYDYLTDKDVTDSSMKLIENQWQALPDYTNDKRILPMIDVSASMEERVSGSSANCMDMAVALGMYVSEKQKNKFKDCYLTFETTPSLHVASGTIKSRVKRIKNSSWGGSTNIQAAIDLIFKHQKNHSIPVSEMPEILLILSDMQFDPDEQLYNESFMNITRNKYGDNLPLIVFWNLNSHDNAPIKFDENGVVMVSGFSPSILKSVLSGKTNPIDVMIDTIMDDRYNY